ncbi:MAG: biotin--[acetyl-CoA-carboxylase] ligase [Candidatus Gastranaerophilales bacterium]|nr:biotin--[acetyl-CoA-carboxylase] ligase [Candidatus Gastranaerophilales bacterium]
MKAKILALLRERADYVSGQEQSEYFGVSRTAVWKAINQLKKEGYPIEAVQNRGYRLMEETEDVYGRNELGSRMRTKWVGQKSKFYSELGSTNAQAKIEAENGAAAGTLIVADMQTAGRGRRGRTWSSPANTNIYYTLILKPDFSPDKAPMLTLLMGLSVAKGMEKTFGDRGDEALRPEIKWPNDVVVNGKKVCGILTEMSIEHDYIQNVVVGVGINVKKQEFEPELAKKATSLEAESGVQISRCTLIANIMESFEKDYETFCRKGDLSGQRKDYNKRLVNKDKEVRVLDPHGEYQGVAKGISDIGELIVELADGTIREVFAGEVSVRGLYGYA